MSFFFLYFDFYFLEVSGVARRKLQKQKADVKVKRYFLSTGQRSGGALMGLLVSKKQNQSVASKIQLSTIRIEEATFGKVLLLSTMHTRFTPTLKQN